MDRWLENDMFVRILSLLIAISLWVAISTGDRRDEEPQRVIDGVTITFRNLDPRWAVTDIDPETVSVTVRGDPDRVGALEAGELRASVNLEGAAAPGRQLFTVEGINIPPGVTLVAQSPTRVAVTLEPVEERTFEVQPVLTGEPAAGYAVGTAGIEKPQVVLRGARSQLGSVSRVEVVVDVQDATDDIVVNREVRVVDAQGQPVSGVTASPTVVELRVPVTQVTERRLLPVGPRLIGEPAQGYIVTGTTTTPARVTVEGPLGILDQITEVPTEPVDINRADEDVSVEAKLVVPQGLELLEDPGTVRVEVRIEPEPAPEEPAPEAPPQEGGQGAQ